MSVLPRPPYHLQQLSLSTPHYYIAFITHHPSLITLSSTVGFAFAAAAVITAQLSMVCSASLAGRFVPRVGTKPLFLLALVAIPVSDAPLCFLLLGRRVVDAMVSCH